MGDIKVTNPQVEENIVEKIVEKIIEVPVEKIVEVPREVIRNVPYIPDVLYRVLGASIVANIVLMVAITILSICLVVK
jgi:hypothetical protein